MPFVKLCSAAPTLPPGWREWNRAELDALLAETAEATAHRKPGSKPSAHNHGWDAIVARVMDPARLRLAEKVKP